MDWHSLVEEEFLQETRRKDQEKEVAGQGQEAEVIRLYVTNKN